MEMNLLFISHRGNLTGPNPELENNPKYIDQAIVAGYHVEVDVWALENGKLFLGHDMPQYEMPQQYGMWLRDRSGMLWIHCKNLLAVEWFNKLDYNWFWHQNDTITLTSFGNIWAYPGKQPIKNSIAVLPEIYNDDLSKCIGICSDYVKTYKDHGSFSI